MTRVGTPVAGDVCAFLSPCRRLVLVSSRSRLREDRLLVLEGVIVRIPLLLGQTISSLTFGAAAPTMVFRDVIRATHACEQGPANSSCSSRDTALVGDRGRRTTTTGGNGRRGCSCHPGFRAQRHGGRSVSSGHLCRAIDPGSMESFHGGVSLPAERRGRSSRPSVRAQRHGGRSVSSGRLRRGRYPSAVADDTHYLGFFTHPRRHCNPPT